MYVYVCTLVKLCVRMCVHMYTHVYVHVFAHNSYLGCMRPMCMCVRLSSCVYGCVHMYTCTYMYSFPIAVQLPIKTLVVCQQVYVWTQIRTHVCTYGNSYIVCTHMCMYMCICWLPSNQNLYFYRQICSLWEGVGSSYNRPLMNRGQLPIK